MHRITTSWQQFFPTLLPVSQSQTSDLSFPCWEMHPICFTHLETPGVFDVLGDLMMSSIHNSSILPPAAKGQFL